MSKLIPTPNNGLQSYKDIAKKLATSISSQELSEKLALQLAITSAEALDLLNDTKLESAIHEAMVEKIVGGSLAIKAMEVLKTKMDQGNLQAASMVLGFNKLLRGNTTKAITNMQIHSTNALVQLDQQAVSLLSKKD